MRTRAALIAMAVLLGGAALVVFLRMTRFDTTLEFRFHDSVSKQWVWDSTARLQDRLIRAFFQSDTGPVPFLFSHLKPGPAILEISAPGYLPVSVPVKLRRGANRLETPIEMVGYEIPSLERFYLFERLEGGDLVCQLRPVGGDGRAMVNHPCLPLWVGCRVAVQIKDGAPVTEPVESGSARGKELFRGGVSWEWDPAPETPFRYTVRIPGARVGPDPALYRVIDYLIVVPDPRRITPEEVETLMRNAPALPDFGALKAYLEGERGRLRYFFDTSWNVKGREE
jgi:hypothetical protein